MNDAPAEVSGRSPDAARKDDRPVVRVGLLWHSASSGNLGVGALTIANIAIIREVADGLGLTAQLTILGMRDRGVRYVSPSEADVFEIDTRRLFLPGGLWARVGRQDCVADIGAGDSFADIYGWKRFMFLWVSKVIALARRRPLMLSPQTIGPFTRWPYRQLAAVTLNGATVVAARDDVSLRVLRELAPRANGLLSVDVAFALPFTDHSAERHGKIRVGVNVSGLLFNEAETGSNRFGLSVNYARLMRRFLTALDERSDVEIHLVSHVVADDQPEDDDGRVADRLHAEFPKAVRVPTFPGPSEAKSYISGLDFLVAGRMHACIGAFSAGTAVVPVAYSRKFSGLFGMLDYPWLLPVTGLEEDEALAYLLDALARRKELQRAELDGMRKVAALLDAYKASLAEVLQQSVRARK